MKPIIDTYKLRKKYGDTIAVDSLNLSIYPGEVFGLLGPNGAGKSTTILMLMGLSEPTFGKAMVCSYDASKQPLEVKKKVGFLPDNVGFYKSRTALENLIFIAQLNGISFYEAKVKGQELLVKVGLGDVINKKVGAFSKGMIQRLGLAEVLIKDPEVIILDEPTTGIDPSGIKDFLNLIVSLSKKEQRTVLFSSHHLHQVQHVCDRVGIFVKGRLLACGDMQTLSKELFNMDAYSVEVEVDCERLSLTAEGLKRRLQTEISSISNIQFVDEKNLLIGSGKDIRLELNKALLALGIGVVTLKEKHYGLDEIYQKYFEGGKINDL